VYHGGLPLVIGTGVNDNRGGAFNTFYEQTPFYHEGKHCSRFEWMSADTNSIGSTTLRSAAASLSATRRQEMHHQVSESPGAESGFQNFLLGRVIHAGGSRFLKFSLPALDFSAYIQDRLEN